MFRKQHFPLPRIAVAVAVTLSRTSTESGSCGSLDGSLDADEPETGDLGGFDGPLTVEFVLEPRHLEPLEATQCGVTFKLHFPSRPGQQVVVTGSEPSLGSWNPQQGLKLTWTDGHMWTHEEPLQLPAGQQVQYKYVVLQRQRPQQLWSTGENLGLEVPGTGGSWTLQDTWQHPSNGVVQEGIAPEACLAAAAAAASAAASIDAPFGEVAPPPAESEAAALCEHAVGSEYPVPIKYKCFLCGQCMQPHLHERSCPRGYSDADVERIFEDTAGGTAGGLQRMPKLGAGQPVGAAASADAAAGRCELEMQS